MLFVLVWKLMFENSKEWVLTGARMSVRKDQGKRQHVSFTTTCLLLRHKSDTSPIVYQEQPPLHSIICKDYQKTLFTYRKTQNLSYDNQ